MCTLVTSGQVASNTLSSRPLRLLLDGTGDAVRGEDHGGAVGHLVQLLDEYRAEGAQPVDDVAVVHHLVAHVDGRAEQFDRALDDVDGAVDAGAEAARIGEQYLASVTCLRARPRLSSRASSSRQHRADGDGRVGDVEGRERVRAPVHVDEIDHVAVPQPVDHVAERAAEDSARPQASRPCAPRMQAAQPDDQQTLTPTARADEQPALPAGGARRGS